LLQPFALFHLIRKYNNLYSIPFLNFNNCINFFISLLLLLQPSSHDSESSSRNQSQQKSKPAHLSLSHFLDRKLHKSSPLTQTVPVILYHFYFKLCDFDLLSFLSWLFHECTEFVGYCSYLLLGILLGI
jgi:hypothetical protein